MKLPVYLCKLLSSKLHIHNLFVTHNGRTLQNFSILARKKCTLKYYLRCRHPNILTSEALWLQLA